MNEIIKGESLKKKKAVCINTICTKWFYDSNQGFFKNCYKFEVLIRVKLG